MTSRSPAIPKWPFILADVALLLGCAWVINQAMPSRAYWVVAIAVLVWSFGAWICIMPWIREHQAQTKHLENETLTSALEQIQKLEDIGARVQSATASWQSAQDAAARVTTAAQQIEERIKADSKDFMEFAERINGDEKQHLRLEVEKLRRAEAEWLQVAARMLDHTFALTTAALRSGQPNLGTQMTNFQNACRDAARRVGLVAFHPGVGDPFEDRSQQLEDPNAKPEEGAIVSEILATGYTFQGQLLRKALVRVGNPGSADQTDSPQEQAALPPHQPLEAEQQRVEEAQAALAEVAEQVHEQRRDEIRDVSDQPEGGAIEKSVDEFDERNVPEASAEVGVAEDFVVDTYRPSTDPAVEEAQDPTNAIPSGEVVVEAAAAESAGPAPQEASADSQSPEEEKPRRRLRKPDPQTSLPF